ncbi:dihydrofolate reductase family protein [Kineosporia sp. A_224]|uniref:dihydrofolate reductase family protein n=1 Tax=Kineosporia sp. A_224 TaxID=1962180 RepID=UPI000B4A576D|nr:dihydrofolate reductase family protein [Kineosporia sp. A_224]
MSELRLLLPGPVVVGRLADPGGGSEAARTRADAIQALADLYAYPDPVPETGWVRANMASTLDGAAAGPDGRSRSISSDVDRVVFSVLRGLADVVLVGAGTARAEGYGPLRPKPEFAARRLDTGQWPATALAFVTRSGKLPDHPDLFRGPDAAWVVTCAAADVEALREKAGERVLVAGEADVDPAVAVAQLAARGMRRVLLEGGPTLLARTAATGRVDELCFTLTPRLEGGDAPRIAHGAPAGLMLRNAHLLECEGTLLGRWYVQKQG